MFLAYLQQFQPQGPVERDLVEEMVAAKWRQRRLWAIEADLLEDEMLQQKAKLDEEGTAYDPITPLSFAYAALAASKSHPFLTRNESRLERAYSRALKILLELQRLRPNQNMQERTESQFRPPDVFPPPTNHHHHPPTRNEKRETRNQKRETRNEKPETSHQPVDVTVPNSLA